MPKKVIILYGPYGAGKSSVIEHLIHDEDFKEFGALNKVRHLTTRTYRPDETPEADILSVSEEEFNRMQENGELVSNVHIENGMLNYNNGTSYADLEKEGNLILDMNPEGIEHLDAVAKEKNWQLFKIYLHANIYDREDRMVERNLKSVPLENRTDTHYMISDIAVWQRMKKDTNPQTPYSEKDADLVIENKDFNEAYSAIKEGVRGFLSRREYDERAMELRRK